MAVMNSSLVLLSIFLMTTSLMVFASSEFGASSLPPLHTAVTPSPSDDSSTFHVSPHYSSVKPYLQRDSAEDERKVRFETSDAPDGNFAAQAMVMLIILVSLIFYGAKIINFMLLPITTVIVMVVLIAFRL